MLNKVFYISIIATVFLMLLVLIILPVPSQAQFEKDHLLIKNATVFDGTGFSDAQDLLIENGIIKAIGKDLVVENFEIKKKLDKFQIIDASGKTIIPGLIDAHTHSFANALDVTLNFGVTTHVDMFSSTNILSSAKQTRNTINNLSTKEDSLLQADVFSAGMLATVEGGHGTQFQLPVDTLSSPSQAQAWVDKRLAEGSDFIKLVYMPYNARFKSLDRATASAIIKAAHQKNTMVVAHISSLKGARELLDEGIDGFVHIFADEKVDDDFVEYAQQRDVFFIPTLSIIASADGARLGKELALDSRVSPFLSGSQGQQLNADFGGRTIDGFNTKLAIANTRVLHKAGVRILAGSDAPNPGTTYGASLHQEMALLVQAGLSPSQALASATTLVADTFKLGQRGRLKAGSRADFVILDNSPQSNIDNTLDIMAVYKNGKEVQRELKRKVNETPEKSPHIANGTLSDFAQGLTTPIGAVWDKTDDSIMSGHSNVELEVHDGTLKVSAQVQNGFTFPWAGASLVGNTSRDISKYKILEFRVRGTPGQYQTMVFSGSQVGIPPSQAFSVDEQWRTVQLEISDFNGLDTQSYFGMAIIAGPKLGEFVYYLDDVKLLRQ